MTKFSSHFGLFWSPQELARNLEAEEGTFVAVVGGPMTGLKLLLDASPSLRPAAIFAMLGAWDNGNFS